MGREGQELLVEEALSVEGAEQLRPTLDEDQLAGARPAHRIDDGARANRTAAATHRADLDGVRNVLPAQLFLARGCRHDQRGHLAGGKYWQAQIEPAAAADDRIQRRSAFAERCAQPVIFVREPWKNIFGGPEVIAIDGERSCPDDYRVRDGAQ